MKERLLGSDDREERRVYIVPRVRPPVFSGEEGSRAEDLRSTLVIPYELLRVGATVHNLEENVVVFIRPAAPSAESFDSGA